MLIVNLNLTSTLCFAIVFFIVGVWLKNNVSFFNKFCIPSPVIGGLLFTFISLILRISNIININVLDSIMPFFMNVFFTILGLNASLKFIKKGGKLLFKYWVLCGGLALSQNIISVIMAKITGIHPLIGLMCGTISLEGGHGNAAAFGNTIENLGVNGAITIGLSAATIGVILGGVLGAPVSRFIITKNNLKPTLNYKLLKCNNRLNLFQKIGLTKENDKSISIINFFEQILIILLCINFGELLTNIFYLKTSIIIPNVVCSMTIACIFRNVSESFNILNLNFSILDFLSEVSLSMFLIIALMSINLLDLVHIAGPMLIIIFAQVLFVLAYAYFIAFKVLGKNFDAAVMISGLIGHGLGNTPNALANMKSITSTYGQSEKAVLIVPLVGAFLLDIFTLPCILFFINLFK